MGECGCDITVGAGCVTHGGFQWTRVDSGDGKAAYLTGPDGFQIEVDTDDVNPVEIEEQIATLMILLNNHWPKTNSDPDPPPPDGMRLE